MTAKQSFVNRRTDHLSVPIHIGTGRRISSSCRHALLDGGASRDKRAIVERIIGSDFVPTNGRAVKLTCIDLFPDLREYLLPLIKNYFFRLLLWLRLRRSRTLPRGDNSSHVAMILALVKLMLSYQPLLGAETTHHFPWL